MSRRWLAILLASVGGIAAVVMVSWFLLSEDALLDEVWRGNVPGTNLTLVLYKDEKNLTRYRAFVDGKKASELRLLGGLGQAVTNPKFQRSAESIKLTWGDQGLEFIEFDLSTCQIVRDSNQSGSVPRIEGCRRTE